MAIAIDYKWSDKIVSPISKTGFSTKASNSIDTLENVHILTSPAQCKF